MMPRFEDRVLPASDFTALLGRRVDAYQVHCKERAWSGRHNHFEGGKPTHRRRSGQAYGVRMIFPYEHKLEFIRANAEIQSRFLQAIPGNRARQTEQGMLEACRIKLRGLAELHQFFLKSHSLAESDQRSYLRAAITRVCIDLFGTAGQHYPELEVYRDSVLR